MARWIIPALVGLQLGIGVQARADDQNFSNWKVHSDETIIVASTANESGGAFGVACDRENNACSLFVGYAGVCSQGISTPFLVSSMYGSSAINGRCESSQLLKSGVYSQLYGALQSASSINFLSKDADFDVAAPNMAGSFAVQHFSGAGMPAAINALASLLKQREK